METETLTQFAERIDPRKFNFSPKLTALVGAIIGHDYGVRDQKGGRLTELSITSDGFVVAASTAHESGAFVGDAAEMAGNIGMWLEELSAEDRAEFLGLHRTNVRDWRGGVRDQEGTPERKPWQTKRS